MKNNLLLGASLFASIFISNNVLCDVKEVGSKEEFDQILKDSNKLVIVKFHSEKCGHCITFKPKFFAISNANDADFVAVETNNFSSLANDYHVTSLPTVVYFKNGKEVSRAKKADKASIEADIQRLK